MEHKRMSSVTIVKKTRKYQKPTTLGIAEKTPEYTVLGFEAPVLAEDSGRNSL